MQMQNSSTLNLITLFTASIYLFVADVAGGDDASCMIAFQTGKLFFVAHGFPRNTYHFHSVRSKIDWFQSAVPTVNVVCTKFMQNWYYFIQH